jgi:hypothetical protein
MVDVAFAPSENGFCERLPVVSWVIAQCDGPIIIGGLPNRHCVIALAGEYGVEAPGGFEPPVFAVLHTAPFGRLGYGANLEQSMNHLGPGVN